MIVHTNPVVLPRVGQKKAGYDNGFRRGTFDKCNGKPARALDGIPDTKYNRGYIKGYLDGYCSNDSEV
jgi:hypothetical protein